MSELYLCDPAMAVTCSHDFCARWGRGECFQTTNTAYAQRTEAGTPIVTYRDDLPCDGTFDCDLGGAARGLPDVPEDCPDQDGLTGEVPDVPEDTEEG